VTGGIETGAKEGWYEDPSDHHEYRWFSQGTPTDLVKDGSVTSRDPISIADAAAFESMELSQPPDDAPVLRSGSALPSDAYHVGAAFTMLDPPGRDVPSFTRLLAGRPRPAELLVLLMPLFIGLALIGFGLGGGVIVILGTPVLALTWLPWRLSRPGRTLRAERRSLRALPAVIAVIAVAGFGVGYYLWNQSVAVPTGPGSYLLAGRTNLVFVQWRQPASSGAITGTITFVSLAGKPPAETVAVERDPFTGQLDSADDSADEYPSISLTVNDQFMSASISGTFQHDQLVLDVPSETSLEDTSYVLLRSSPAAYSAALRTLTARSQRGNKTAAHG
jgi:hypothetical protein